MDIPLGMSHVPTCPDFLSFWEKIPTLTGQRPAAIWPAGLENFTTVMQKGAMNAETESQTGQIPSKARKARHKLPPGPGRPKGLPNKVTQTIKDAIEAACRPGACHAEGLYGWLVERAQGGIEDRKVFAGMVQKALPAQLQAQVQHGGVVVQLGWLTGRGVGRAITPASQSASIDAQVIEMQGESLLDLRVTDTTHALVDAFPAPQADPLPPVERQGGVDKEAGPPAHLQNFKKRSVD